MNAPGIWIHPLDEDEAGLDLGLLDDRVEFAKFLLVVVLDDGRTQDVFLLLLFGIGSGVEVGVVRVFRVLVPFLLVVGSGAGLAGHDGVDLPHGGVELLEGEVARAVVDVLEHHALGGVDGPEGEAVVEDLVTPEGVAEGVVVGELDGDDEGTHGDELGPFLLLVLVIERLPPPHGESPRKRIEDTPGEGDRADLQKVAGAYQYRQNEPLGRGILRYFRRNKVVEVFCTT